MQSLFQRSSKYIALCGVLVLYAMFLCRPIQLSNADIGRHVMNGKLLLQSLSNWQPVLYTNMYSYTQPQFSVINHHWGSGILFALSQQLAGWVGVHVLFITVSVLTLWLFADTARRISSSGYTAVVAVLALPFIVQRLEVRPEAFSYLCIAGFLWVITAVLRGDITRRWLWVLPACELLWSNLHVYFPFGVFLVGIFGVPALLRKDWALFRLFLYVGLACAFATILTPFGIKGALYPFTIFQNYGYTIAENQSVFFLENWGMQHTSFMLLRLWSAYIAFGVLQAVYQKKWLHDVQGPLYLFGVVALVLAWFALRNFTLFGLVLVPVGACILQNFWQSIRTHLQTEEQDIVRTCVTGIAVLCTGFVFWPHIKDAWRSVHIGLLPHAHAAATFMQEQGISGPIFNNYDNGGYLIYELFSKEKVFVDNRPEAYPSTFFTDVYIPMQEKNTIWNAQVQKHNFNAIVFYYRDQTPWAQTFLQQRIQDKEWIPVYADNEQLILVRDNEKNTAVIQKHAIDAASFTWR